MSQTGRLVLSTLAILVGAILAYTKTISGDAWISLVVGIFLPSPFERRSAAPPGGAPAGGVILLALCTAGACDRGLVVAVTPTLAPATAPAPRLLATSVTPITTLSAAGAGLPYSGESYDIACSVSGSVTLYPAVYDRNTSAWAVYQQYPCALAASVAVEGTCTFPARAGTNLLWNAYQTGGGSVSGCTAAGRQGPVPAGRSSGGGGGGGSGTVTSVGLSLPAEFTVSGSPVTTSGTLTGTWAAVSANTALAGPTSGAAAPPTFRALVADDLPNTAVTPGTYTAPTLVIDQQGRITNAVNGSGGGPFWIYNPPERGAALGSPVSAGSFTTGWLFRVYTAIPILGVRIYWPGGAVTLYCRLWDGTGTELRRKDITVAGSGLATATFAASYAPTPGANYYVGCYESTGTSFAGGIVDIYAPSGYVQNGPWTLVTPTYAAGDNWPLSDATWTYPYPLRPIFLGEQ